MKNAFMLMPLHPSIKEIYDEADPHGAPPLRFSGHILQESSTPDLPPSSDFGLSTGFYCTTTAAVDACYPAAVCPRPMTHHLSWQPVRSLPHPQPSKETVRCSHIHLCLSLYRVTLCHLRPYLPLHMGCTVPTPTPVCLSSDSFTPTDQCIFAASSSTSLGKRCQREYDALNGETQCTLSPHTD
jgi:hypothetical protein